MKRKKSEFIAIGHILSTWGVAGKLKVKVLTDFPDRFAPGARIYVKEKAVTLAGVEWQKGMALVSVEGIDSIKKATALVGGDFEIQVKQLRPLPEGSYYHFELIGLNVFTTTGKRLGYIAKVLPMTSNDNYVVKGEEGEVLIPAIADVVKEIDLEKKKMTIEAIPGLLELNKKAAKD